MKKIITLGLLLVILVAGCSPGHYVRRQKETTKLFLRMPGARQVLLAASFDGFRPRKAKREGSSLWVVEVPEVSEFSYFYLVDGEIYLPDCALVEKDDFGGRNCIFSP